jgi:hypothetical protein
MHRKLTKAAAEREGRLFDWLLTQRPPAKRGVKMRDRLWVAGWGRSKAWRKGVYVCSKGRG